MKKKLLSFLMAAAMLLNILPQLTTEAEAETNENIMTIDATHEIVMTADEFVDCLWKAYSRPNYYRNEYPYNLGYYNGSVIYFDCWNLGKAIIWTKGSIVDNYTVGAYASMDTSCGLGDWDGLTIIKEAPNCNSDFSELVPGEWLYKDGHTGYYVGDGQVIECTPAWGVWGITISQIDSNGGRSKNGVSGGSWLYHGMVPWLDYSTETWVEKAAFDAMVYRDRNPDLADMTDAELKEHWLNHGIEEGRASSPILDLGFYLNNNSDLKEAFGSDYTALYNHFITSGYKEYRKSSALFDGKYYCDKYPDVASSYKEEYMRHYVETGIKEGRRASLTFDPDYYWYIRPDVAEAWPGNYEMCAKHYAGHGVNAQIQAYDNEYPVVSDVTISDITGDGYTVSCKVTDNWGIEKVVFPTWTIENDQDDLADNFMNTQLGTENGDTYTFTVNASDHNNENGEYITHIYAIDKGGNQTQLVLDPVEVQDLLKLTLVESSQYSASEGRLGNVQPATTVGTLLGAFENENLEVTDNNGNIISGTAIVGTGTQINLYLNGQVIDSLTVIIMGDVDGNGAIDATDYARVKSAFLGSYLLNEIETSVADVDGNGIVDTTDYMRIKAHFLGTYSIST